MSIVTKQGDKGKTRLFSGEEVSKNSDRIRAYGTLDELVSVMGVARALCKKDDVAKHIHELQRTLFRLGTELATKDEKKVKLDPINAGDIEVIEALITHHESKLKLPKEFVIPGRNTQSATIDVARTVCRRFERSLVGLQEKNEWKNESALIFINRLSDLLFLMARSEATE